MRLLALRTLTTFVDRRSGQVRELEAPDGLATHRQLHLLNRRGLLAVVEHGQATPLTKGEAAYVIDAAAKGAA